MLKSLAFLLALIGAVGAFRCLAADLSLTLISADVLEKRLRSGLVREKEREATIQGLFSEAGCTAGLQPVRKNVDNVICTLPGETQATIIVGGHYDFRTEGQGIIDDWSGTAMLASLYETLKSQPHKHTYKFVAFAAEEAGLIGSGHFIKVMTAEEKSATRAFVNLECLGLATPKVWVSRSAPELLSLLRQIADAVHVPVAGVNVDRVGDDDTQPFRNNNIPVLSIHSVTIDTLPILHTKRDTLSAVHMDDYTASYRLIAFYLAFLDNKLAP